MLITILAGSRPKHRSCHQPLEAERREKKDEQFGSLAGFQVSTSAMLFYEFDCLVGCRTTEFEGYVTESL